jgi:hypothetical protein
MYNIRIKVAPEVIDFAQRTCLDIDCAPSSIPPKRAVPAFFTHFMTYATFNVKYRNIGIYNTNEVQIQRKHVKFIHKTSQKDSCYEIQVMF